MTSTRGPRRRRGPRHRRSGHEEGSISLYVVVVVIALFTAVGLVVDGSGRVQALQTADSAAQEAARAAGQAVDPADLVDGGPPSIDTAAAARAARSYLQAAGVDGTVVVTGRTVHITTTTTYRPVFLTALGDLTQTGEATARLTRGIDEEDS